MAQQTAPIHPPCRKGAIYIDVKWLIILAIVAFLLVFLVFPLVYMLYKAFFPESTFSLSTFTRLYTYEMNWGALAIAHRRRGHHGAGHAAGLSAGVAGGPHQHVRQEVFPACSCSPTWCRLSGRHGVDPAAQPECRTINTFLRELLNIDARSGPLNIYTIAA